MLLTRPEMFDHVIVVQGCGLLPLVKGQPGATTRVPAVTAGCPSNVTRGWTFARVARPLWWKQLTIAVACTM